MRNMILCLVAATVMGRVAAAQETKHAEVLVLGVYHMANPGHDIFNMQADDVLAPKRQQEIAELASVLAKFKPTKIAVENDSQAKLSDRYAKYLAGQYALTTNEIDQIGLRLAKDLGHTTIYAVDADLGWLRQDFASDPTLRLRKLEEFAPAATGAERH